MGWLDVPLIALGKKIAGHLHRKQPGSGTFFSYMEGHQKCDRQKDRLTLRYYNIDVIIYAVYIVT